MNRISLRSRRGTIALVVLLLWALPGGPARAQSDDAEEWFGQIQARVVQLRHLQPVAPLEHRFVSRDELRALNREAFLNGVSPEELDATTTLLVTLGLIPPGLDVAQMYLDAVGDEIYSLYDADTQRIYVAADSATSGPDGAISLAHELTRALQDQHFDVAANRMARRSNNDQLLAYDALVVGDASLSETIYALRYVPEARSFDPTSEETLSPALASAPLVVQRELMFLFDSGLAFILDPFLDGSWDALAEIWADPPSSTAQVLHPDKYLAGIAPREINLPDLNAMLGPAWRTLDDNTLGELDLRILLEQYLDHSIAEQAADGWAGDRYQLLRRDADGAVVFAMSTTWDTARDAREFFVAYQQAVAARPPGDVQPQPLAALALTGKAPDAAWVAQDGDLTHVLVRDGADVILVLTTDPTTLALVDEMRARNESDNPAQIVDILR